MAQILSAITFVFGIIVFVYARKDIRKLHRKAQRKIKKALKIK